MKTYEYYGSSPDGWNVSGARKVEGNERFDYSEGQTDYTNASLSGGAAGTWRRDGNALLLRRRSSTTVGARRSVSPRAS